MNGSASHDHQPTPPYQAHPAQLPPGIGTDTPLAYYQPIAITPGTIKWVAGAVASVMLFLAGSPIAERYMSPAKQSDLVIMQEIVKTLQVGQHEQRTALERLTLAVDNLAGIVTGLQQSAKVVIPKAKSLVSPR